METKPVEERLKTVGEVVEIMKAHMTGGITLDMLMDATDEAIAQLDRILTHKKHVHPFDEMVCRAHFQDAVYYQRFKDEVPQYDQKGMEIFRHNLPDRAHFLRRDPAGLYVEDYVQSAWWGWMAAINTLGAGFTRIGWFNPDSGSIMDSNAYEHVKGKGDEVAQRWVDAFSVQVYAHLEPHPPRRDCPCADCAPSFEEGARPR